MEVEPQAHILLQLHIAEYNALTNRNTYWIVVSFSFWPALILYLGFLPFLKQWSTSIMVSVGIMGSEMLVAGWYFCVWELFKNTRYVEAVLKPRIMALIKEYDFWEYESYMQPLKGSKGVRVLGDYWASLLVVLGGLVFTMRFPPHEFKEIVCSALSVVTTAMLIKLTFTAASEGKRLANSVAENINAATRARGAKSQTQGM